MHLANIGSRSAFLELEEADRHIFLAAERERLCNAFPSREVEETYLVDLLVGTELCQSQPALRAIRSASSRLRAPSLICAFDR
jgi:hypothetical protein